MQHQYERGQGLVEYALILVMVAIVVISILGLLGPSVGNIFSDLTDVLAEPPTFAELGAAVTGCVTHNGARNALMSKVSNEDVAGFRQGLADHASQIDAGCYTQLSVMAARM